jgi:hypothetical protein
MNNQDWIEQPEEEEEGYPIAEYDLTSTPNDFNVLTIISFIESGAVKIPGFQRNYVWDIKRASKLIESLIIGLPVPQLFLYEEAKNSYLVIDGQQRLMTIYYFVKQIFPKKEKRIELGNIFDEKGKIPQDIIDNDNFFTKFNLKLTTPFGEKSNTFNGKNYETLGEYKTSFDLRTIRNIIVKPTTKEQDNSAVHELFNRLNTGGVNLSSQEIRMSLYHSNFMTSLLKLNEEADWKRIISSPVDIRMQDVEIILRAFAILAFNDSYRRPMTGYLDRFANQMKKISTERVDYLNRLFKAFLEKTKDFPEEIFKTKNNRFSVMLFESVFYATCKDAFERSDTTIRKITAKEIERLKSDSEFIKSTADRTTSKDTVQSRLNKAREILVG